MDKDEKMERILELCILIYSNLKENLKEKEVKKLMKWFKELKHLAEEVDDEEVNNGIDELAEMLK